MITEFSKRGFSAKKNIENIYFDNFWINLPAFECDLILINYATPRTSLAARDLRLAAELPIGL